ncbi:hypothetical protein [Aurantimonas aggregata]|nr:hypothetical protein [Aurantimonas aggregata]
MITRLLNEPLQLVGIIGSPVPCLLGRELKRDRQELFLIAIDV